MGGKIPQIFKIEKVEQNYPDDVARDATAEAIAADTVKNADAFAELIQYLDDRSLSADENVTDYMLRAQTAATSLKSVGEQISDSLLIAKIIKGLPSEEYKPFSTVVTQKDKDISFSEFKVSLRSFEATQKVSTESDKHDNVVHVAGKPSYTKERNLMLRMQETWT